MAPHFDPQEHLPKELQERLDSWDLSPPKSQFQAYGPLNAYFQGHKFPSTHFLTKPQKMLRDALVDGISGDDGTDPIHDDERKDPSYMDEDEVEAAAEAKAKAAAAAAAADGDDTDEEDHLGDGDDDENEDEEAPGDGDDDDAENEDADISMGSIDSSGAAVSNTHIFLPDFSIDRYYGADTDDNPNPDKIRVVVEVASLVRLLNIEKKHESDDSQGDAMHRFKQEVESQLSGYLSRSAQKHDGRILGVAILGNEVLLRKARKLGSVVGIYTIPGVGSRWISFFDPHFVEQLNIMRDMELND